MYFFTCGQPRRKTDRHVTGEKEKSGKKERVRRKNRFPPPPEQFDAEYPRAYPELRQQRPERGCNTLEHGAVTKDPITGYTLHRDQKRS